MQFKILHKIEFRNDKVYISVLAGADGKHSPSSVLNKEDRELTKILKSDGTFGVFKELGRGIFEKTIRVQPQSCVTAEYLKRAGELLNPPVRFFLDPETAASFIATVTVGYLENPFYTPRSELEKLRAIETDPEKIFAVCQYNPTAFVFADASIRHDPALALRYIKTFAHDPQFVYPGYFKDSREHASAALSVNPNLIRCLSPELRNDFSIIRAAYTPKSSVKVACEYNAAFIGSVVLATDRWMREIVRKCPNLDISDCPHILYSRSIAEGWILYNADAMAHLELLPPQVLAYDSVRQALQTRADGTEWMQERVSKLLDNNPKPEEDPAPVRQARSTTNVRDARHPRKTAASPKEVSAPQEEAC